MDILNNDENRILLDRMIKANESEDNTEKIRNLRHSYRIEDDIRSFVQHRARHERLAKTNFALYKQMAEKRCEFLYNNYTNIFNKLVKDELNLQIMHKFIMLLREIENGSTDQNEASVKAGMVLKELYIDSAMKHQQNEDAKRSRQEKKSSSSRASKARNNLQSKHNKHKQKTNMSWIEFKKKNDL
jgi:nitrous oxide reductase